MAITVSKYKTTPAIEHNKWFLEKLELVQRMDLDDTATPQFSLKVTYRMFGVDESHTRHFDMKNSMFEVPDFFAAAVKRMQEGDWDLINAAGAIEIALAELVEEYLDVGNAEVV